MAICTFPNTGEFKMSAIIFSIKCPLVYLSVTGNKRPYAQVLLLTRSPTLIFWCLKFNFPVIVTAVGRYRDSVKKNKRSSKSKVTSFSASPCTLIIVFLYTIQHSISSRKLHQLHAVFFSLNFCKLLSSEWLSKTMQSLNSFQQTIRNKLSEKIKMALFISVCIMQEQVTFFRSI